MDKKSLEIIQDAIWHVKNTISTLACEHYPVTPFSDDDLGKMFYDLNDMCIAISKKIDALDGKEGGPEQARALYKRGGADGEDEACWIPGQEAQGLSDAGAGGGGHSHGDGRRAADDHEGQQPVVRKDLRAAAL